MPVELAIHVHVFMTLVSGGRISSLNENPEHILIPRGFIGKLLRFCIEKQISYILNDQRIQKESLKHYKHHRHLRYLSKIHESAILKLRFVLEPFSFVF